jgi:hypothetical protein
MNMYGEKCVKVDWRGNLKEEEQLEKLGVERFVIFKLVSK